MGFGLCQLDRDDCRRCPLGAGAGIAAPMHLRFCPSDHLRMTLGFTPWAMATAATDASGFWHSPRTCGLNSELCTWRLERLGFMGVHQNQVDIMVSRSSAGCKMGRPDAHVCVAAQPPSQASDPIRLATTIQCRACCEGRRICGVVVGMSDSLSAVWSRATAPGHAGTIYLRQSADIGGGATRSHGVEPVRGTGGCGGMDISGGMWEVAGRA